MNCPSCHRAMMSSSYQLIEDENGAMTITQWRCRPCHETAEEILLSAGYRGLYPTRIRYAVALPLRQGQIVAPIRALTRKGKHANVGAIKSATRALA